MQPMAEEEGQQQDLLQLIAQLRPLRQQRQFKAERAQRQAQAELKSMLDHIADTRQSFGHAQENHRQQRQSLMQAHLEKSISLSQVELWQEKEQNMLDRLAHIRQDIEQQQQRIVEQRARLEQLQQQNKAAQRAVEKLACLGEVLTGEG